MSNKSMSRVYLEGWYSGVLIKVEDWYIDGLVYANVRQYFKSTATSRPDVEKSFLLKVDDPDRLPHYAYTLADCLSKMQEVRDKEGRLVPVSISLPKVDFFNRYREMTPEEFAKTIKPF